MLATRAEPGAILVGQAPLMPDGSDRYCYGGGLGPKGGVAG